jgi:hypothetical protein
MAAKLTLGVNGSIEMAFNFNKVYKSHNSDTLK